MSQRVYLDTAPVIYAVEDVAAYSSSLRQLFAQANVALVASDLTRLECRVKPIRENDSQLLSEYDLFFAEACSDIVALSREVIDRAAEIRAEFGFRTPDAIHLAAAVVAHCEVFLTNDSALERFSGIAVELVK